MESENLDHMKSTVEVEGLQGVSHGRLMQHTKSESLSFDLVRDSPYLYNVIKRVYGDTIHHGQ